MPEEKREFQELFQELSGYENRGIQIELEGSTASPMQVVSAHMVKEENAYMRDYVLNEKGDIIKLYFNLIQR